MTGRVRPRRRQRVLTWAVVAAAVVVVVLVVLVADGVLVLPSASSASPVTITSVQLHVIQGTTGNGNPWFGPSYINYTGAEGYPIQVTPGGTWSVVWTFLAFDNVTHTIFTVTPSASPSTAIAKPVTEPALPYLVPGGSDDVSLRITLTAPSNPGATYAISLVVQTLTPS